MLKIFPFSFQNKMTQNNPWEVESIQDFYFLRCPECDFDTKGEDDFQNHAYEHHPLSCVFFGLKPKIKRLKNDMNDGKPRKYIQAFFLQLRSTFQILPYSSLYLNPLSLVNLLQRQKWMECHPAKIYSYIARMNSATIIKINDGKFKVISTEMLESISRAYVYATWKAWGYFSSKVHLKRQVY